MIRSFLRPRLLTASLVLAALVLSPLPWTASVSAQATLNATTLGAAVTVSQTSLLLASATSIAAGQILVVDREAFLVQSAYVAGSTTVPVTRGYNGTFAATHASGAVVFSGPPSYFPQSEVSGPCVTTNEVALPRVVITSGNVYQCISSQWVRYRLAGFADVTPASPTTYTVAGAITIKPGASLIGSAGALAMTLAAPAAQQNGLVIEISALTAQAHTITVAGGVNGGGSSSDVCTLTAAIGNGITLRAYGGVWYMVSSQGCALA